MDKKLFNWVYRLLKSLDMNEDIAIYVNLFINIIIISILGYLLDQLFKKLLIEIVTKVGKKTKIQFNEYLVDNKTIAYIAHIIPLFFIYETIPLILSGFVNWENFFDKTISILIVFLLLGIVNSMMNALKNHFKKTPAFADKPLDSYIQVVKIFFWMMAITIIASILFNKSVNYLLGTFGAVSAIVILVFKDTILGFVASIQVSVNDMVRIGDWITMDKFGADGDVIEINLATVKVQNFDKTTTTIPTYSLISDSFKNWRGMTNSGGRRIKRSILIKANSVRFLDVPELEKFKEIQLISSYIDHRQKDIEKWNTANNVDKSLFINGRNLTNFGLFRKYINQYLSLHPGLNKEMTMMCRHLQPTSQGLPLEIYAFVSDKRWLNYESIMADIFDHVIASTKYFDLEVYELSSDNVGGSI